MFDRIEMLPLLAGNYLSGIRLPMLLEKVCDVAQEVHTPRLNCGCLVRS